MTDTTYSADTGLMACVEECQDRVERTATPARESIAALGVLANPLFDSLIADQQAKIDAAEAEALRAVAAYITSMWQFRYAQVESVASERPSWKAWTKVLDNGTRFARVYFGRNRDDYVATLNEPLRRALSFGSHATKHADCKAVMRNWEQRESTRIATSLICFS